jgi:hypothetical protein
LVFWLKLNIYTISTEDAEQARPLAGAVMALTLAATYR